MQQPVIRFVCTVTFLLAGIMAPLRAQAPVKTAEIAKRGLTAQDFPRVLPLVPNVYAYEDVHVQGAITTNALIVITTDGVVVVDGQGTVPQTERMVAEIRKLSDKPIRYVIIGSNHADHTGGNSAFPQTATFISHPVAQAAFQRAASQPPGKAVRRTRHASWCPPKRWQISGCSPLAAPRSRFSSSVGVTPAAT
jgi:glyoxylase-like metal-dependent hydrolase (beta-lactamase superfamily II)